MFFHNDGKSFQAAKCIKSRITTKVINSFLSIDAFEQECIVTKFVLHSPRLKYHVKTIVIKKALSDNDLFEQKHLQNINKLYKHAW